MVVERIAIDHSGVGGSCGSRHGRVPTRQRKSSLQKATQDCRTQHEGEEDDARWTSALRGPNSGVPDDTCRGSEEPEEQSQQQAEPSPLEPIKSEQTRVGQHFLVITIRLSGPLPT